MTEPEKLQNTLSAIFKRKGQDGKFTRLFENFELSQKEWLLQKVQLGEGELPVIGSAESQSKWMLVTTSRIVWYADAKMQSLPAEGIRDVVADLQKLVVTGRRKNQMTEIQILTMNGEQYTIEVEEGAPLMGVWNALKNLGARNRKRE
jgi:hypothetical protein